MVLPEALFLLSSRVLQLRCPCVIMENLLPALIEHPGVLDPIFWGGCLLDHAVPWSFLWRCPPSPTLCITASYSQYTVVAPASDRGSSILCPSLSQGSWKIPKHNLDCVIRGKYPPGFPCSENIDLLAHLLAEVGLWLLWVSWHGVVSEWGRLLSSFKTQSSSASWWRVACAARTRWPPRVTDQKR